MRQVEMIEQFVANINGLGYFKQLECFMKEIYPEPEKSLRSMYLKKQNAKYGSRTVVKVYS